MAVKPNDEEMKKDYLRYVVKTGNSEELQEALQMIETKYILQAKTLITRAQQ